MGTLLEAAFWNRQKSARKGASSRGSPRRLDGVSYWKGKTANDRVGLGAEGWRRSVLNDGQVLKLYCHCLSARGRCHAVERAQRRASWLQ